MVDVFDTSQDKRDDEIVVTANFIGRKERRKRGRKNGRKEERKKGRKEERKKGRKEERKEERKKGRQEGGKMTECMSKWKRGLKKGFKSCKRSLHHLKVLVH